MSRRDAGTVRPGRAGRQGAAATRDALVDYLNAAPPELRSWARLRLAELEQETAADPGRRDAAAPADTGELDDVDELDDEPDELDDLDDLDELDDAGDGEPGGTGPVDADPDLPDGGSAGGDADLGEVDDELDEGFDDGDELGDSAPRRAPRPRPRRRRGRSLRQLLRSRVVLVVGAVVVLAGVVVGVHGMGSGAAVPGISGNPTEESAADGTAIPLDTAKVAELMRKIDADPRDVASLAALGDLYFASADYATASSWQQKVLAVEPKNVTAHLALGAAQFNLGNAATAEKQWLQVVALDPKQAEAHYDLGFLYLSQDPPDMAKVRAEWTKVIAIDPNSQIARTVATHLQSLGSASATATPSGSAPQTPRGSGESPAAAPSSATAGK